MDVHSSQASSFHNWSKLPGEHPNGDKLQIGFFVGFMIVWITDTVLHGTTWLNQIISLNYRLGWGAFIIIIAYCIIRRSEADLFYRPGYSNSPIHHGIYSFLRHPMYLGDLLFHVGIGILSISVAAWVMILISVGLYNYLCNYEEQSSIKKWGEVYLIYMKIVPRWVPKFKFLFSHPVREIIFTQDE